MGVIQFKIQMIFILIFRLHYANGQIAAIAITLPHIISLLENVTETLSPTVPQVAALLKNQQHAQMITNDKIANITNAMMNQLERNYKEPDNFTQQLITQNQMITSVLNPVVGLLQKHDQFLDNLTDQMTLQNQILTTMATLLQKQTERIQQQQAIAQDCTDILDQGFNQNYGTYTIKPKDKLISFEVVCDLITEGGGWIIIQKRFDGSEDFYRPWKYYKNGFGDMSGEHWLGLDKLHRLTRNGYWQLRIELEDFSGNTSVAQYANFDIGDEASYYRLMVGEYTGTVGDVMDNRTNMLFSTYDQDHDESNSNCAKEYKTAWWFGSCHGSNLNSPYLESSQSLGGGIFGGHGKAALKVSEMKMRRICDSIQCQDTDYSAIHPATTSATMTPITAQTTLPTPIGQDCSDVLDQGFTENYGIYRIQPSGNSESIEVVCDLETNGEGWIVFQRRFDGSENFYRSWKDYKNGFGNLTGEHWLGLEKLYRLTTSGAWQLRVELEDFSGNASFAQYANFAIGNEASYYRLMVGEYAGTAGDVLVNHTNTPFSTYDHDHDESSSNCAEEYETAWWFVSCNGSNLNDLYLESSQIFGRGIVWGDWKKALKVSEMKMRKMCDSFECEDTDYATVHLATALTTSPTTVSTTKLVSTTTSTISIGQDCQAVIDQGFTENYGIYRIQQSVDTESFDVVCDLDTNGEGWIVFQRRFDGSEDFFRPWMDYKNGFGNLTGEHWLGLEKLQRLTVNGVWQLRIDLEDFYGNTAYAVYSTFAIGDGSTNYRLSIGGYSGTAGDGLLNYSANKAFSTYDQDHDTRSSYNCAQSWKGAWWYGSCAHSNLNGLYIRSSVNDVKGMVWLEWKRSWEVLKKSEMKIRRI